jgi:hypothetical protein
MVTGSPAGSLSTVIQPKSGVKAVDTAGEVLALTSSVCVCAT